MQWQQRLVKIAESFAASFEQDPNIIGITLNGGIARGTGDKFSEIDIHFYVKDKMKFPYRFAGDVNINNVWFDIWITTLNSEYGEKEWEMGKKWDRNHCKILFDRYGEVKKLFQTKLKIDKKKWNKLAEQTKFEAGWCLQLAETFLNRKESKHAHLLLNESLDRFVDYYFLKQNMFIPAFKWKYYYFERLPIQKAVKRAVFNGYLIRNYSFSELKKRFTMVKHEIVEKDLREEYFDPHSQDLESIKDFERSLIKGLKLSKPW